MQKIIKTFGYGVGTCDGHYGEVRTNSDGEEIFTAWGQAIDLTGIFFRLEDDSYFVLLEFVDIGGQERKLLVPREQLADNGIARFLSAKGASVSTKRIDVLQHYLNALCENYDGEVRMLHSGLGWYFSGDRLVFRADRGIGHPSIYDGTYDIKRSGSFAVWVSMVRKDVLPHTALTVALLAGLSAVLVGFLSPLVPLLNPILSFAGESSTGKSTAGILAASTAYRPILGTSYGSGPFGEPKTLIGGISSWAATKNALIGRLQGNCGMVAVLDEISKSESGDLSAIVYSLSEGADKDRMTKECNLRTQENFHCTIVSIGEERLSDRCKKRLGGLSLRVLEIPAPFTESAEHANRIATICRSNYGHAAPRLAKALLKAGAETVIALYQKCCAEFKNWLPASPFRDRRAQQFGGLLLATAVFASKALKMDFDIAALTDFLVTCENADAALADKEARAYDNFFEWFGMNRQHFISELQGRERFGKIYERAEIPRQHSLADNVTGEVAIFPSCFAEFCRKYGHQNRCQLLKSWIAKGFVVAEDGKHTYRRKIDGVQQRVIVIRKFRTTEDEEEETEQKARIQRVQQEYAIIKDDLDDLCEDCVDASPSPTEVA